MNWVQYLNMRKILKLELKNICKYFQDVKANQNVNIDISSGEILGLLGENGAGKTTLMNILYGIYHPDEGDILINSKKVQIKNPRDSIALGIGMVHQHFMLIQNQSVAENVALIYKESPQFFPSRLIQKKLVEFAERYGLHADPDKMVWQLSAGEQQRVEIVKTLLNNADLLILDEPTSVLTPQEARDLFQILRRMKVEGHSVILISHKLEEILEICDRVVVLRKGKVVGESKIKDVNKKSLAHIMVGRDVIFDFHKDVLQRGEKVLEVIDLTVRSDRQTNAVKDVSFTVYQNEIFGIAGVSGNGQKELIEAITGLRKSVNGKVIVESVDITNLPVGSQNVSISHVPEERIQFGVVPNLSLFDNAVLKQHHNPKFSNRLFLDYTVIREHAAKIVKKFQVDTPSVSTLVKNLSGGNIQKLILGREISEDHTLLVAAHPTYGLDVGATEFIRNHLLKQRNAGCAILLVSEDLEEIYELCDRVAVMFDGRIVGIMDPEKTELEEIGLMMAGSSFKTIGAVA